MAESPQILETFYSEFYSEFHSEFYNIEATVLYADLRQGPPQLTWHTIHLIFQTNLALPLISTSL